MIAYPKGSKIPIIEKPDQTRVCRRCGIEWIDSRSRYVDRAPCRDCREILEREGADLIAEVRDKFRAAYSLGLSRRRATWRQQAKREGVAA